jgi:hypothetical protein
MQERINEELALIRARFPGLEYVEAGRWVRIPAYPLPQGWNREATDVAFQIQNGHPGVAPYGIYVPSGIQFDAATPTNYKEPADNQPSFGGSWGIFSWAPADGQWKPAADVRRGSNLLGWVLGFADRFEEGR